MSSRYCGAWPIIVLIVLCASVNSAAIEYYGPKDPAQLFQRLLDDWAAGYWIWRTAYTVLTITAVTLPALVAAGIWKQDSRRHAFVAAAASAVIAVTAFLRAGERATSHEHAYLCMRLAMASYRSGLMDLNAVAKEARHCASYIDYDYLDEGATPKSSDAVQSAPAPAPAPSVPPS